MATPVPAVERAAQVVDLLARRPGEALTGAQIARTLGLSRATCFATLVCLSGLGWVRRDPDRKTYRLGPELVRLGWAAIEAVPGAAVARREMFGLAAELDVGCFACCLIDDDMVVLDRAGTDSATFDLPGLELLRVPARPPLGSIYYAWSPPAEIDAWLTRAGGAAALEANRRALAAIRGRGYSIGGGMEVQLQLEQLLERLSTSAGEDRLALALSVADLVRGATVDDSHPITYLIAPAFDPQARVAVTLTIVGRQGQVHGANVEQYATPLLAAMERVTAAIGGRRPE